MCSQMWSFNHFHNLQAMCFIVLILDGLACWQATKLTLICSESVQVLCRPPLIQVEKLSRSK